MQAENLAEPRMTLTTFSLTKDLVLDDRRLVTSFRIAAQKHEGLSEVRVLYHSCDSAQSRYPKKRPLVTHNEGPLLAFVQNFMDSAKWHSCRLFVSQMAARRQHPAARRAHCKWLTIQLLLSHL